MQLLQGAVCSRGNNKGSEVEGFERIFGIISLYFKRIAVGTGRNSWAICRFGYTWSLEASSRIFGTYWYVFIESFENTPYTMRNAICPIRNMLTNTTRINSFFLDILLYRYCVISKQILSYFASDLSAVPLRVKLILLSSFSLIIFGNS